MNRAFAALMFCVLTALPAAAQPGAGAGEGRGPLARARGPLANRQAGIDTDANAQETVRRLQEMLQQYPPSLSHVLALDPTLLTNDAYLQPYPQLANFLAQHPEIAHNPTFFFDQQYRENSRRNYDYNDPKLVAVREIGGVFAGFAGLIAGLTFMLTVAWVIRSLIEHRKWLRVSKTHMDTHAKLMDRLTSSEDLIAYMESPAGRKFLEAAPIPLESGPRSLSAPFGRILWSVQAGVVIAFLGAGLIYASRRLAGNDLFSMGELPVFVLGSAAMAIGAGFFVSAIAAYALSRRLGLFPTSTSFPDSGNGHAS